MDKRKDLKMPWAETKINYEQVPNTTKMTSNFIRSKNFTCCLNQIVDIRD